MLIFFRFASASCLWLLILLLQSRSIRGHPVLLESCLYATYVRAVARVYFNRLALVDEEGYTYGSTRLYGGRLQCIGCCITLQSRLGIGNLLLNLDRHVCIEYGIGRGIRYHVHYLAFEQEVYTVDQVVSDGNLVESLLVHELVVVTVVIQILIGTTLYTHILQLLTDVEAAFQYVSVYYVLQLGTHEGVSLTRLYMQKVDAEVKLAVHADASSDFDVLGINHT